MQAILEVKPGYPVFTRGPADDAANQHHDQCIVDLDSR